MGFETRERSGLTGLNLKGRSPEGGENKRLKSPPLGVLIIELKEVFVESSCGNDYETSDPKTMVFCRPPELENTFVPFLFYCVTQSKVRFTKLYMKLRNRYCCCLSIRLV